METETKIVTAEDFLIRRSYRKYPEPCEHPYVIKNLYEHRLTELETNAVCETNGRLFIHIKEYQFVGSTVHYEIGITAERNSLWWELKAYSLSAEELIKNITTIENSLIKMFNGI